MQELNIDQDRRSKQEWAQGNESALEDGTKARLHPQYIKMSCSLCKNESYGAKKLSAYQIQST